MSAGIEGLTTKRWWRITVTCIFIALSSLLLAYAILAVVRFPRWAVDDAFILFRYAENLATTGRLSWNPGENPVEGYTGVALIVLIAAAIKLGISPLLAAHFFGIFFFFAGAVLLVLILRGFNLGSTIALALYFTAPFMYAHVWSGLETTMFVAAILFALYAFTQKHRKLFIASLLLLGLVRPEGALLSIILLALYRPFSINTVIWFLLPAAAYFIWRWAYYGRLMPNTFYAKTVGGKPYRGNVQMLRELFTTYLPMPALLALIYIRWEKIKEHKYLIIGIVLFCLAAIYTSVSAILMMTFSYRLFVPFYVLAVLAISAIITQAKPTVRTILLVLLLILPQAIENTDKERMKIVREYCRTHYAMLLDEHIKAGKFLRERMPPDEWLIVHADAGAIPFYSKLRTVDFGRLNNEYLTRKDITEQDIADYFYSFNAGAVVFTSYHPDQLDHGEEAHRISSDSRFENYTIVKKYKSNARRRYYEFVYLRSDLVTEEESLLAEQALLNSQIDSMSLWMKYADGDADDLWDRAHRSKTPSVRLEYFKALARRFPDHASAPMALFMVGLIYSEDLHKPELARQAFEELRSRYPNAEIAGSAYEMLESLNTERLEKP
jgi:hypothetical protein